jgi:hypothetical protein
MLLNQRDVLLRAFLIIGELTAKSGFVPVIDVSVGGGLLIHSALFVLTPFHLFCHLRRNALICRLWCTESAPSCEFPESPPKYGNCRLRLF